MIRLRLYDSKRTKRDNIESIIEICKQIFNETLGENFFQGGNLKVAFCNFENRVSAYEEFCEQFFPLYLREGYSSTISFVAQAFTNESDNIYGILVCLDAGPESDLWYQIILHEMCHIFCIMHEIGGENFEAKYSKDNIGNNLKSWNISIGYAVWREFIADYIASQFNPLIAPLTSAELREAVRDLDNWVNMGNPDRSQNLSQLLCYIFLSPQIQGAEDEETIVQFLVKNRIFANKACCETYREFIALILKQLKHEPCWEISPAFIEKLGIAYTLSII